jgi:hypothetical protein
MEASPALDRVRPFLSDGDRQHADEARQAVSEVVDDGVPLLVRRHAVVDLHHHATGCRVVHDGLHASSPQRQD